MDRDGNMVSLIQSNYSDFGSGSRRPKAPASSCTIAAGFLRSMRLRPMRSRRTSGPLHTIIPAFMEKGNVRIAFGIMGGWNQSQAHAQYVSHIVDFNQNIQAAMETRALYQAQLRGLRRATWKIACRVTRARSSKAKGHVVQMHNGYSNTFGGGQAVMRDFDKGVNYGASDPRKDGAAVPELPNQ